MAYANDNPAPISGKAARQWPAMTRAISQERSDMALVLARFARLYELAHRPADAVPSVSGTITHDTVDAALLGEVEQSEEGRPAELPQGFSIYHYVDFGPSPDFLAALSKEDFRIQRQTIETTHDGERHVSTIAWAEYRDEKGRWRRIKERYRAARRRKETANPLREGNSLNPPLAVEERLNARQELALLRRKIGDEAFEVLRLAAVERSTAQRIGETRGARHKPASALGGKLLDEAISAANDNWPLAEAG
ncbi:MAG: hypothetical protein WDN29_02750 [Methylovirgula sp.]